MLLAAVGWNIEREEISFRNENVRYLIGVAGPCLNLFAEAGLSSLAVEALG